MVCGIVYDVIFEKYENTISVSDVLLALPIMLPLCGFPPAVAIFVSARSRAAASQMVLLMSSLLYGIWFAWLLLLGTLSGKMAGVMGFMYLPVLLPCLIVVCCIENMSSNKRSQSRPNLELSAEADKTQ